MLDHRGEWLAAQRPDWSWVPDALSGAVARSAAAEQSDVDWAHLPSSERLPVLAVVRADDPARARSLVESTWTSDSARDRAAHLGALRVGLDPEDEPLLERALDDRAASVRDAAAVLLDGLPGSARAGRMAERLRPLIQPKGVLKRSLEMALPDPPDAAGVRDGLGKPPGRRSVRGWWLERICAGAPLDVWTDAAGWDPATIVSRLSDADALSGIRQAVRLRRDPTMGSRCTSARVGSGARAGVAGRRARSRRAGPVDDRQEPLRSRTPRGRAAAVVGRVQPRRALPGSAR